MPSRQNGALCPMACAALEIRVISVPRRWRTLLYMLPLQYLMLALVAWVHVDPLGHAELLQVGLHTLTPDALGPTQAFATPALLAPQS
jgi:hypothetical protein